MKYVKAVLIIIIAVFFGVAALVSTEYLNKQTRQTGQRLHDTNAYTPPYHKEAPVHLPHTLPPNEFSNSPTVEKAYTVASKVRPLFYQLPCYCRCDKTDGHKCLLDCYTTRHARDCYICEQEAFYAYKEYTKGESVSAIRGGIIKGNWKNVVPKE